MKARSGGGLRSRPPCRARSCACYLLVFRRVLVHTRSNTARLVVEAGGLLENSNQHRWRHKKTDSDERKDEK